MNKSLLVALLLLPGISAAVICKTIEEDGTVSYADVPASECPEQVKLPDYSRYTPRPITQTEPTESSATGTVLDFNGYKSLKIVQPEANGTVRNNEGIVPVVMVAEPAFQPGHKLQLRLDSNRVPGDFDGLSVVLNGVNRGSHTLRASIWDAAGKRLIESQLVRFTLRKTGLNDRPATPENPIAPVPPGYDPPSAPDYSPSGTPSYQPGSTPSAPASSGNNPAFKPNFSR
jgi:hypothetical protein